MEAILRTRGLSEVQLPDNIQKIDLIEPCIEIFADSLLSSRAGFRIQQFSNSRLKQNLPWALRVAASPLFKLPDGHFVGHGRALHAYR